MFQRETWEKIDFWKHKPSDTSKVIPVQQTWSSLVIPERGISRGSFS